MQNQLFLAYCGDHLKVSESFHERLKKSMPWIDLHEQYGKMENWLHANPRRRKTESGMPRFIVNWLNKVPKPPEELRAGMGPSDYCEVRVKPEALKREMERRVVECYKSGANQDECGKRFGLSVDRIREILRNAKVEMRKGVESPSTRNYVASRK